METGLQFAGGSRRVANLSRNSFVEGIMHLEVDRDPGLLGEIGLDPAVEFSVSGDRSNPISFAALQRKK